MVKLAGLCAGYLVTAVLPERWDPWMAARLASVYGFLRRKRIDALAIEMRSRMPDLERDWPEVARESVRVRVENYWTRVRGIHRPPGLWELHVEGLDHYAAAKASGKGVILWRMAFCGSPVVSAALHAHGISPVHLSTYRHGAASDSWWGLRLLSPFFTRAEMWYLAERVVIEKDGSLNYLRVLLDRLNANATLSIFADGEGRQLVTTRVLGRMVKFPTGSPGLAYRRSAALLPVYGERLGPYRYRVVIEAPIAPPEDTNRTAYIVAAVTEYAHRLEAQIRAHPADWHWKSWRRPRRQ